MTEQTKKSDSKKLPKTSRSLPIALIRARENVMAPIREMLADSGLSEQQWRVLRVLAEFGPQDATKLAERACLLAPSLTRITRSMSESGLIMQTQDEVDRRRQKLIITSAGVKIIDSNRLQALEIVEAYKAKLGNERYEQLLDLLEVMASP